MNLEVIGTLLALAVTLSCELPMVCWLLKRQDPVFVLYALAVNLASNLTLSFLIYYPTTAGALSTEWVLFLAEVIIFLLEGNLYWLYSKKAGASFLASLLANLVSWLIGTCQNALFMAFGWPFWIALAIWAVLFVAEITTYGLYWRSCQRGQSESRPQ